MKGALVRLWLKDNRWNKKNNGYRLEKNNRLRVGDGIIAR